MTDAITFNKRELATVLAALRLFQHEHESRPPEQTRADWPDHFVGIAPLAAGEIDALCERVNRAR